MSSISRVLRIKFGKKEEDDETDKKEDDGEKKAKHSIDGILGDKGREPSRDTRRRSPRFPTPKCAGHWFASAAHTGGQNFSGRTRSPGADSSLSGFAEGAPGVRPGAEQGAEPGADGPCASREPGCTLVDRAPLTARRL